MAEAARRRKRFLVVAPAVVTVIALGVLLGIPGLVRERGGGGGARFATGATGAAGMPDAAVGEVVGGGVARDAGGEPARLRADTMVDAARGLGSGAGAAVAPGATAARVPAGPIVSPGRTVLPGGAVAVRSGDTVEVHFDTPATRTRRPEKFERIVRATLPAVYGAAADSALAAVPEGLLASQGDLLTSLPERGVRLPTTGGETLVVWPETRPGRDGPLVVTYRATILR